MNVISNNLAIIEKLFAREATDVDKAIELYTDDIIWESPARDLLFEGTQAVANNYRRMHQPDASVHELATANCASAAVNQLSSRLISCNSLYSRGQSTTEGRE